MKRILQVIGDMNYGGIPSFIMNLYRKIDRTELQFDFLLSTLDNDYNQEIESLGGRIYYISPRNKSIIKHYTETNKFFKEHHQDYDTIHLHSSALSCIYPLEAATRYGIKNRILHIHGECIVGTKLHYIAHLVDKLRVKHISTHYFACSKGSQKWGFKGTGCYSKSRIIKNGIDTDKYIFNESVRKSKRAEWNIAPDEKLIIQVAAFNPIKNHRFTISVFNELLKISPKYKLFLAGEGPLMPEIKDITQRLGINNKVTFLGGYDKVNELLSAADAMIFPSFAEGLPIGLLEAQCSSLVSFCSDSIKNDVKITEYIRFLSLKDSPTEWANIINDSIDKYLRCNLSSSIKDAGYDSSQTLNSIIDIYKS